MEYCLIKGCPQNKRICCKYCDEECLFKCMDWKEFNHCRLCTNENPDIKINILKKEEKIKNKKEIKKYKINDLVKYFKKSRGYFIKKIKNKKIISEKINNNIYISEEEFNKLKEKYND